MPATVAPADNAPQYFMPSRQNKGSDEGPVAASAEIILDCRRSEKSSAGFGAGRRNNAGDVAAPGGARILAQSPPETRTR